MSSYLLVLFFCFAPSILSYPSVDGTYRDAIISKNSKIVFNTTAATELNCTNAVEELRLHKTINGELFLYTRKEIHKLVVNPDRRFLKLIVILPVDFTDLEIIPLENHYLIIVATRNGHYMVFITPKGPTETPNFVEQFQFKGEHLHFKSVVFNGNVYLIILSRETSTNIRIYQWMESFFSTIISNYHLVNDHSRLFTLRSNSRNERFLIFHNPKVHSTIDIIKMKSEGASRDQVYLDPLPPIEYDIPTRTMKITEELFGIQEGNTVHIYEWDASNDNFVPMRQKISWISKPSFIETIGKDNLIFNILQIGNALEITTTELQDDLVNTYNDTKIDLGYIEFQLSFVASTKSFLIMASLLPHNMRIVFLPYKITKGGRIEARSKKPEVDNLENLRSCLKQLKYLVASRQDTLSDIQQRQIDARNMYEGNTIAEVKANTTHVEHGTIKKLKINNLVGLDITAGKLKEKITNLKNRLIENNFRARSLIVEPAILSDLLIGDKGTVVIKRPVEVDRIELGQCRQRWTVKELVIKSDNRKSPDDFRKVINIHGDLQLQSVEVDNLNNVKFFNGVNKEKIFHNFVEQKVDSKLIFQLGIENNNKMQAHTINADTGFNSQNVYLKSQDNVIDNDIVIDSFLVDGDIQMPDEHARVVKPIGTSIEDFHQFYSKTVQLRGNLFVNNVDFERAAMRVVLLNEKKSMVNLTAISEEYWRHQLPQFIRSPVMFHQFVNAMQLHVSSSLNGRGIENYWHDQHPGIKSNSGRILLFDKLIVNGSVKTNGRQNSTLNIINDQYLNRHGELNTLSDRISFGIVRIDDLELANDINGIFPEQFVQINQPVLQFNKTIRFDRCWLRIPTVLVSHLKGVSKINNIDFSLIENETVRIDKNNDRLIKGAVVFEVPIKMRTLQFQAPNGLLPSDQSPQEIVTVIIKGNASINHLDLHFINSINFDTLHNIVYDLRKPQVAIGGIKSFNESVTVGLMKSTHINLKPIDHWLSSAVRKSGNQKILAKWTVQNDVTVKDFMGDINGISAYQLIDIRSDKLQLTSSIVCKNAIVKGNLISENLNNVQKFINGHYLPKHLSLLLTKKAISWKQNYNALSRLIYDAVPKNKSIPYTIKGNVILRNLAKINEFHGEVYWGKVNLSSIIMDTIQSNMKDGVLEIKMPITSKTIVTNVLKTYNLPTNLINSEYVHSFNESIAKLSDFSHLKFQFNTPPVIEKLYMNHIDGVEVNKFSINPNSVISRLNLKAPILVNEELQIDTINNNKLSDFLRHTLKKNFHPDGVQSIMNFVTFENVRLVGPKTQVARINNIHLTTDVYYKHFPIEVQGTKRINQLWLQGPMAVMNLNNEDLLDKYKNTILLSHPRQKTISNLVVNSTSTPKWNIWISKSLNENAATAKFFTNPEFKDDLLPETDMPLVGAPKNKPWDIDYFERNGNIQVEVFNGQSYSIHHTVWIGRGGRVCASSPPSEGNYPKMDIYEATSLNRLYFKITTFRDIKEHECTITTTNQTIMNNQIDGKVKIIWSNQRAQSIQINCTRIRADGENIICIQPGSGIIKIYRMHNNHYELFQTLNSFNMKSQDDWMAIGFININGVYHLYGVLLNGNIHLFEFNAVEGWCHVVELSTGINGRSIESLISVGNYLLAIETDMKFIHVFDLIFK